MQPAEENHQGRLYIVGRCPLSSAARLRIARFALHRLARAKADGKTLGRKPKLSPDQQQSIRERRAAGVSFGTLAKEFDVSRAAIQRVEKRA